MEIEVFHAFSVDKMEAELNNRINTKFKPSLAFIFSSVEHSLEKISELGNKFGFQIFGMTTAGEIANDDVYESSIAVMLIDINPQCFKVLLSKTNGKSIAEVSYEAIKLGKESFKNPGFIVAASGLDTDGDEIVKPFIEHQNFTFPLFGGLAGDNMRMNETFVFTNNTISNHGMIYLIVDNDIIEVKGMATSGWEAIGIEKVVTRSEGNIVFEIDGKPALDKYVDYFNLDIDLDQPGDVVETIGVNFPLQVLREGKSTVLRASLYGNKDDKSLVFAGKVPQGSKVKFSVPPTFEIIDTTIECFKELSNTITDVDALIMFSCAARKIALGPMTEDEIKGIRSIWNVPMAGLFTYGEIGYSNNFLDFHNETCSLVILKEKKN